MGRFNAQLGVIQIAERVSCALGHGLPLRDHHLPWGNLATNVATSSLAPALLLV